MRGVKVSVNASVVRNLCALLCGAEVAMTVDILVRFQKGNGFLRQIGEFINFLWAQAQKPRIY